MVIDDHIAGGSGWRAAPASPRTPTRRWCWKCVAGQELLAAQGLFGKREFKAVQGVNFQLRRGHTLGVVGESGSGKTTMGLTLLRLHEPTGGEVIFDGQNLLTLSDRERQPCAGASRSCSRTRTPA
jgi:peptide/nickel transport system ATP-binding protein